MLGNLRLFFFKHPKPKWGFKKPFLTKLSLRHKQKSDSESYEQTRRLRKKLLNENVVLSPTQKQFLNLLDARVFAVERRYKPLVTNHHLLPKENLYAHFELVKVFVVHRFYTSFYTTGLLLITNQRFVVETKNKNKGCSFAFVNVKNMSYLSLGCQFTHNEKTFLLRSYDQPTLNNTIREIQRRFVK